VIALAFLLNLSGTDIRTDAYGCMLARAHNPKKHEGGGDCRTSYTVAASRGDVKVLAGGFAENSMKIGEWK
jgi:hypothetical protein